MPIYAYRCTTCGHAKDVLQKMSDALLTVCPSCGADSFAKQVTAAGFQLKGSGWYVTDFRGGNTGGAAVAPTGEPGKADAAPAAPSGDASAPASAADSSGKSGASAAPATAPASPPSTTKGP